MEQFTGVHFMVVEVLNGLREAKAGVKVALMWLGLMPQLIYTQIPAQRRYKLWKQLFVGWAAGGASRVDGSRGDAAVSRRCQRFHGNSGTRREE